MQFTEMQYENAQPIEGYGPGFFRIGGNAITAPLVITADGVTAWGGYEDADTLLKLAGAVDVLFIGTGPETRHIPMSLRTELEAAGLGVEPMNSAAVARTYNVLIAEGRRVAAALLPV